MPIQTMFQPLKRYTGYPPNNSQCAVESGQLLHVREMFRKWMIQVKGSYRGQMQDGDHTDGHYITLFAEQLTRTFEVLVLLFKCPF